MAWLRIGDNASTHPLMSKLLVATKLDHSAKNEAFGVLVQLAAVSAGHLTDSIVEMGLFAQIAPGRERAVLDFLMKAGIANEEVVDGHPVVRLVLDDEEFIHALRKEQVETNRRRARDKRKPGLYAQVRVRDGDTCRWCGKALSWTSRSGYMAATYDSLTQHKDSTVDSLVIACQSCNSKRGAGEELELLDPPTPERIIYGQETVSFVNRDKWCKDHGISIRLTQPELPIDDQEDSPKKQTSGKVETPSSYRPQTKAKTNDCEEPPWLTQSIDEIRAAADPHVDQGDGGAPGADDVRAAADPHVDQGDGGAPGADDVRAAADPHVDQGDGGAPGADDVRAAADPHVDQGDGGAPGADDVRAAADPHVDQGDGGAPQTKEHPPDPPRNITGQTDLGQTQDGGVTRLGTSGRDGPGRDGPGRDGPGRPGDGSALRSQRKRRRRGRRSGKEL
ncbi:hypothetical protein [Corynebacterium cystitidis]|uniref:hypothetical protein n=1 Tax=Corynebacterium cystitidis TaxID=35757 RepID=UPI00211DEF28|nr:hypothetical protein [Corynebacterium cystitidis]